MGIPSAKLSTSCHTLCLALQLTAGTIIHSMNVFIGQLYGYKYNSNKGFLLKPKSYSFKNILDFISLLINASLAGNNFFFFFWLRCVFIAVHGLSLVAASGGYSSLWCTGFSMRWLLLLRSTGSRHTGSRHAGFSGCGAWASVVVVHGLSSCGSGALECRLSSCGAQVQLLRGIRIFPDQGSNSCPQHWQADS